MTFFHTRQAISRRTVLRGAGVALALPLLEAMSPRSRAAAETGQEAPKRLAVLWMPNGVHPDKWTPTGVGTEFELSPTLEPLDDFKQKMLVLTNLWNQNSDTGDGHYVKCSGFLTGTTINKTVGVDLNSNGISMDQFVAQRIGRHTPLPSLELGTEAVRTGVDKVVGYTRVYGAHISWRSPTMPLAKEIDPRLAFERLLQAQRQTSDSSRRDRQALDLVLEDARRLKSELGSGDQRKLDEYLESVHSVERRLAKLSDAPGRAWQPRADISTAEKPPVVVDEHPQRVRLMLDIIAMAFQTDTTRVSTFMFGNSVSNINFSFVDGVNGAHHSLSHHENEEEKMRQYQLINRWHVEQYAYLVRKLSEMSEGESSVLDNSLLLFGSGLRDGQRHDPHNLPVVVTGNSGGRLVTGQHLEYERDTPLTNLYLALMHALDVPIANFADSTQRLPGVLNEAEV